MKHPRWLGAAALAVTGLVAAGCSSSSSSSSKRLEQRPSASSTTRRAPPRPAVSVFGTPKKATGTPYVFGMINDETGAVTFPEARQGAIAAVDYVNNYLGGINGHPIVIDNCTGDGTPATAARVRQPAGGQAPDRDPRRGRRRRARLDPDLRSTPTWRTWAASRSPRFPRPPPNSIQFWSVSVGDNAAAAVYAGKTLGVKSVAIMYFSNAAGRVAPAPDHAGVQGRRGDDDQGHPAVADVAGPEPAGRPGREQRRPARLR